MKNKGDRYLWMWVGLAFGVLLTAWAVLFWIASKNRVETVPLVTQEEREER